MHIHLLSPLLQTLQELWLEYTKRIPPPDHLHPENATLLQSDGSDFLRQLLTLFLATPVFRTYSLRPQALHSESLCCALKHQRLIWFPTPPVQQSYLQASIALFITQEQPYFPEDSQQFHPFYFKLLAATPIHLLGYSWYSPQFQKHWLFFFNLILPLPIGPDEQLNTRHEVLKRQFNDLYQTIPLHQRTLSVTQFARALHMSAHTFKYYFKHYTHSTLNEFHTQQRLKKALIAHLFSNATQKSIAHQHGYESADTYRKAFKRHYLISPSQVTRFAKKLPKKP